MTVRLNVGQTRTNLCTLLARAGAVGEIDIARDSVPLARLMRIDAAPRAGTLCLAARGSLAGRISMAQAFELSDELPDEPA